MKISIAPVFCAIFLVGILILVAQPVFQQPEATNAGVLLVVVVVVFVFALALSPAIRRTRLAWWLLFLFLIRLGIAVTYHQWVGWRGGNLFVSGVSGYDAFRYDYSAAQVANWGWPDASISVDQFGIVAFYATIYRVFGHNPLFAVLFNTLLGGLTSLLVFHLARLCTSLRVATWSALLTMIIPDSVLYGGLLMKEMLVMFLYYSILLVWFRFKFHRRYSGLILLAVLLYGMMETRGILFVVLVATFGSIMLIEWRKTLRRPAAWIIMGAAIAIIASIGVSNYSRGFNMLDVSMWQERSSELKENTVAQIEKENPNAAHSIGLRTAVVLDSPLTYLFVPFRMLVFFLNPPFWRWGIFANFVPFNELNALLSWLFFPAMVWGCWRTMRRPQGYYLWIPFLWTMLIVSLAPFVDPRYKISLMPLFVLFACKGFEEFRKWKSLYWLYGFGVIGAIIGFYAVRGNL